MRILNFSRVQNLLQRRTLPFRLRPWTPRSSLGQRTASDHVGPNKPPAEATEKEIKRGSDNQTLDHVLYSYKTRDPLEEGSLENIDIRLEGMLDAFMASQSGADADLATERKTYFQGLLSRIIRATEEERSVAQAQIGTNGFHASIAKVTMHNFRGINGTAELDFSSLPAGEVFHISGQTGSGKSTMIEALVWCLFSRSISPHITDGDIGYGGDWISKQVNKTFVTVDFKNGFRISRERALVDGDPVDRFVIIKPSGRPINFEKHENDPTEYFVKNYLGAGLEMFKQTCIIPEDLEPNGSLSQNQVRMMDELFGIRAIEICKESIEANLHEADSRLEKYTTDQLDVRRQLKETSKQLNELAQAMQLNNRQAKSKHSLILSCKNTVQRFEACIKAMTELANENKEHLHNYRERLQHIDDRVTEHEAVLQNAKPEWVKLQESSTVQGLKQASPTTESTREILAEPKEESGEHQQYGIATPGTPTEDPAASILSDSISTCEGESAPTAVEDCLTGSSELARIKSVCLGANIALARLRLERSALLSRIAGTEASYTEAIEQCAHSRSEITKLSAQIAYEGGALATFENRISSLQPMIETQKNTNAMLLRKLSSGADILSELKKLQSLAFWWQTQLKGTEPSKGVFVTFCRVTYVNYFNTLLNPIIQALNRGKAAGAIFTLSPDMRLLPVGPQPLSRGQRPRGELIKTHLAVFLAMLQVSRKRLPCRPGFVFMDDIVDRLDNHAVECLKLWLADFVKKEGMQAFLLTEKEVTTPGNVVEVVKDRGVVHYEYRKYVDVDQQRWQEHDERMMNTGESEELDSSADLVMEEVGGTDQVDDALSVPATESAADKTEHPARTTPIKHEDSVDEQTGMPGVEPGDGAGGIDAAHTDDHQVDR